MTSISPVPVTADRFAHYGKVVQTPEGKPTAEGEAFKFWSDVANYHIQGETEIGLCTVYRSSDAAITWMEKHDRTPEILVPVDGPFLLPVMREENGDMVAEVFRVDIGQAVVIGRSVWHSACLPFAGDEATYFVIFRRGTPSEDVQKRSLGGLRVDTTNVSA